MVSKHNLQYQWHPATYVYAHSQSFWYSLQQLFHISTLHILLIQLSPEQIDRANTVLKPLTHLRALRSNLPITEFFLTFFLPQPSYVIFFCFSLHFQIFKNNNTEKQLKTLWFFKSNNIIITALDCHSKVYFCWSHPCNGSSPVFILSDLLLAFDMATHLLHLWNSLLSYSSWIYPSVVFSSYEYTNYFS